MKFKIGFTVQAETLFHMMSKFLPIEELNVEEIPDTVTVKPPVKESKIAHLIAQNQNKITAPTKRKYKIIGGKRIQLDKGANKLIMELFGDGEIHSAVELKTLYKREGFAVNGTGSALAKMKKRGVIFQPDYGVWQLTKDYILQKKNVV